MKKIKQYWNQKTVLEKFRNAITGYTLFISLILACLSLFIATSALLGGALFIITTLSLGSVAIIGFLKKEDKALIISALPILIFCYLSLAITANLSSLLQPLHIADLTNFIIQINVASVLMLQAIKRTISLALAPSTEPILYRLATYIVYAIVGASLVLAFCPIIAPALVLSSPILMTVTAPLVITLLNLIGAGGAVALNIAEHYLEYTQNMFNLKKIKEDTFTSPAVQKLGLSKEIDNQLKPDKVLEKESIHPDIQKMLNEIKQINDPINAQSLIKAKNDTASNQFKSPSENFVDGVNVDNKKSIHQKSKKFHFLVI